MRSLAAMRVLSVVGNRPQFVKSAPLSVALRGREIDEVLLHTGQHYDRELSEVFFEELDLPEPDVRLDLHTADVDVDDAADPRRECARRSQTRSSSTATRTRRSPGRIAAVGPPFR